MRVRLHPAFSPGEIGTVYAKPHDHREYPDHELRVEHTIALARCLLRLTGPLVSLADLSCGNAHIARVLHPDPILGDMAPGYPVAGPVEQTVSQIGPVDLFLLNETAEHLDDPDSVLAAIRGMARRLVMSTPLDEFTSDNRQHYWGWDTGAVREMLETAGWHPVAWSTVTMPSAAFQIWGCK